MINVGVIGATGLAGCELVRLLLNHPNVKLSAIGSVSFEGKLMEEVYPQFYDLLDLPLSSSDDVIEKSDLVFLSLPHGYSQEIAHKCLSQGKKVIDLGADFRLYNEDEYQKWYGGSFAYNGDLHKQAVYGLCEVHKTKIATADLVANPGCFPTAAALGLIPLVATTKIVHNSIIVDAKTGVTGAGRNPSDRTHFPFCSGNVTPYNLAIHRHTPEIQQSLNEANSGVGNITFSPHLVPVNRGILATCYATPLAKVNLHNLHQNYLSYYEDSLFVKVLPLGETATMNQVTGSNYCHISLHEDSFTGRIIVISAIDNLIKGAAGQAIQNMNIMLDISEETGLSMVPMSF